MNAHHPIVIEPAAAHKASLTLRNPVTVAAGCYGLGDAYGELVDVADLGAVVVGPVTARPRRGVAPPRAVPVPGGVLVHTGLENPGLSTVLRRCRRTWSGSPTPVILHLAATTPERTSIACEQLSTEDAVAAVELGLANHVTPGEAAQLVEAAATMYPYRPLVVRLPMETAADLAKPVVEAGADAVTVAAPPRGTVHLNSGFVTGRLYGPFVLPLALRALRRVADSVSVPLIGAGGITSPADARAFLRSGAVAVQVDIALWRDPAGLGPLAQNTASA
jgi:dihydroorotate dehydrogenase (NAD+) catalytic subunit